MLQTGADAEARASFLRARQRIALDALMQWEPKQARTPAIIGSTPEAAVSV
jgi:hypothetical protein